MASQMFGRFYFLPTLLKGENIKVVEVECSTFSYISILPCD
jgi:hypothetical protein